MRVRADLVQRHTIQEVELGPGATAMDLLKRLGLSPDAHLLLRDEMPIPVDEPLKDGEQLQILAVISGGS